MRAHRIGLALVLLATASAQGPTAPDLVHGYNGEIILTSAPSRAESVIVLESRTNVSETSRQLVLVLQHVRGHALPADWSGRGRLLVSEGLAAIIGDDGTRRVFIFPEKPLPRPLMNWRDWESFGVFGIARYGERTPLTADHITALREGNGGQPAPQCDCDSGGPGSTQCSITAGGVGCSVTCSPPSYACCDWSSAGQPYCKCCSG